MIALEPPDEIPWRPIILKIGGSLAGTAWLGHVLEIAARATEPLVIVPGGGRFADAVRAEQARLGFSDAAAHEMALLAMHQTGLMLEALCSRLRAVFTISEIRTAHVEGEIPVWLPLELVGNAPSVPRDWSVTSDGLAAWLAVELGAQSVLLVKSRPIDPSASARDLAEQGVVDPFFASVVERRRLRWKVMGPGDEVALIEALGSDTKPASRDRPA